MSPDIGSDSHVGSTLSFPLMLRLSNALREYRSLDSYVSTKQSTNPSGLGMFGVYPLPSNYEGRDKIQGKRYKKRVLKNA